MTNRSKHLIILDLLGAMGALVVVYLVQFSPAPFTYFNPTIPGIARGAVVVSSVLFTSYFMELYNRDLRFDLAALAARIAVSVNICYLALSAFLFMVPTLTVGQRFLAPYLLVFGLVQFGCHSGYRFLERHLGLLPRVLVLGAGPLAAQIGAVVSDLAEAYTFVGFFPVGRGPVLVDPAQVHTVTNLVDVVRHTRADKIVIAGGEGAEYPFQEILNCKLNGVVVLDAPAFYERATGKMLIEQITPEWFVFSQGFYLSGTKRLVKRCADILFCCLVLPVMLPFLPFMALILRLDSPGPIFFRQIRVGENEQPFVLYKLRTMNNNAELATGAVWSQDNDPRITRIGRLLRSTRLDEFPQLFNVLRGEMSMVGPRPERPEFIEQLKEIIPYYSERHLIKPGVTGWAQVNYPYGASVADAIEKLRYDLYYLKNFSIQLDFLIILETIKVVFARRGGR